MNAKNVRKQVRIFDTTLRDGQQCPGAGMSFENNIKYAALVSELKVDVVEAGFPSASKVDFEIVEAISKMYSEAEDSPIIAGLCQLRDEQIDITIESLAAATKKNRARLHTYVPVDPGLMQASLGAKADKKDIQEKVYNFVKRAFDAGLEVEFSPEGYSRCAENFDFVTDLIRAAVEGGAKIINCPDTIGGACTLQGDEYFVNKLKTHSEIIAKEYPNSEVIWSCHCHNDYGLAVQNSINAVTEGPCLQVEGCFNGVGERAGNAALESVIMILDKFSSGDSEHSYFTNIDVSKIQEVCDFVAKHMLPRQPHWPISGENAARHSSGGHTNAILKNPLVYQPFDPRAIGKNITFLFGPLSGGNHAKSIIEEAGYLCEEKEKAEIAQFVKELFKDRRKGITDVQLLEGYFKFRSPIVAESINYSKSTDKSEIHFDGQFFDKTGAINEVHMGRDSALAALKMAVDKYFPVQIQSHKSKSKGSGYDAISVSKIVIASDEETHFEGIGEDNDIELSAIKAFINAINNAYLEKHFRVTDKISE